MATAIAKGADVIAHIMIGIDCGGLRDDRIAARGEFWKSGLGRAHSDKGGAG
jgi:hypothetical protein